MTETPSGSWTIATPTDRSQRCAATARGRSRLFAQRCGVASTPGGGAVPPGNARRRQDADVRSATWRHTAGMCSAWTWAHGSAATLTPSTVTIPGTPGAARGTFVDMGNPHVVCGDRGRVRPRCQGSRIWIWSTKPVVSPVLESDQNAEFVRVDEIDAARRRRERRPCASTSAVAAKRCPAAPACAPRRLRCVPKPASDHWDHHRAWRHPARGRHR